MNKFRQQQIEEKRNDLITSILAMDEDDLNDMFSIAAEQNVYKESPPGTGVVWATLRRVNDRVDRVISVSGIDARDLAKLIVTLTEVIDDNLGRHTREAIMAAAWSGDLADELEEEQEQEEDNQ